jgi:tRNA modification GTPase
VLNKRDLGACVSREETAETLGSSNVTSVSAVTGEGLEELRRWIYESTVRGDAAAINRERIAVNTRQGAALREARDALSRLAEALEAGLPAEILSVELRAAADACGKISGRNVTDELLDRIFSAFCNRLYNMHIQRY